MFGVYEGFPAMYHSVARFSHRTPTEKLQRVVMESLYRINRGDYGLDLPEFAEHNINITLELGIADGLTFSYVDRETLEQCQERSSEQMSRTLDFLCVACYHVTGEKRQSPLRFDYYLLRFLFNEKEVELQVFHERGTRRLSIEDLMNCLTERINQGLARKRLSPLRLDYVRPP